MTCRQKQASAAIRGADAGAGISGRAVFRQCRRGVLVTVEVTGLPQGEGDCPEDIFALHIHSGTACTGTPDNPFADANGHYNPKGCEHPSHAGDLPPLFGCGGYAYASFLTDRFTVEEIIGRTVIIHARRDDFTSQPSGDSGEMLACGRIVAGG